MKNSKNIDFSSPEIQEIAMDLYKSFRDVWTAIRSLSNTSFQMDKFPEVQKEILSHKSEIITNMLKTLVDDDRTKEERIWPIFYIKAFRKLGFNWPEFDVIINSMLSDGIINKDQINEQKEWTTEDTDDELIELFGKWSAVTIWRGIAHTVSYFMALEALEKKHYTVDDFPKLKAMIEKHKDVIIKELLLFITDRDDPYLANQSIYQLSTIGLKWPEFKIISDSIAADDLLDLGDDGYDYI